MRAAILEARESLAPAWVTYGTGRCALAANRDLWDAEAGRFAVGYNPGRPRRRHAARREGDRRGRRAARDALQLRLPPDDARLGEPAALAGLHRRRARGPGEHVRRPGALPAGSVRASSRRATTIRARRASPTATAASSGTPRRRRSRACRRPAPASSTPASSPRAPISARGPTSRATPGRSRPSEQLAAGVSHGRAAPQGGPRRRRAAGRRDGGLDPGAGEGAATPLPQRGARRRTRPRDADLDLAARRGAARRDPERAVLGAPGRAAAASRPYARVRARARPTGRWATSRPRRPTAPGSTRSSSRPSRPVASSRRSRSRRRARGRAGLSVTTQRKDDRWRARGDRGAHPALADGDATVSC